MNRFVWLLNIYVVGVWKIFQRKIWLLNLLFKAPGSSKLKIAYISLDLVHKCIVHDTELMLYICI